jgi:HPt (histidine-containing phosphotransfer) domain-containing protein
LRDTFTALLGKEDRGPALDAAISLKVCSAMIGAHCLAGLAQALESAVRKHDFSSGGTILALISDHGRATVRELQTQYLHHRGYGFSLQLGER